MTKTPTITEKGALDDLNELKGYFLGTLALGAAATTFLTQAFHTPLESTLIGTTGVGVFFLIIVYLVNRAERRMVTRLNAHVTLSDEHIKRFHDDIEILKDRALENQRSSLRNEMDNEIYRNPSNHDTIIRYAYKYFYELNGDWVQTEKFLAWRDSEEAAGRPVHLPNVLIRKLDDDIKKEGLKDLKV